jgi:hypothetical protein
MMTHSSTDGEPGQARPAAVRLAAARAEEHAGELRQLLEGGTLSPDGQATAHGALSLLHAVLALRETIADAGADTVDAVGDVDATLSVIAGAVTGDGEPAAVGAVLLLPGGRR